MKSFSASPEIKPSAHSSEPTPNSFEGAHPTCRSEARTSLKSPTTSKRRVLLYGFVLACWLVLLGMGYVGYLHTVVPLRQQVLAQEVRSLELALDSIIRERCLVVDAVAGNLEMDAFLKQKAMPTMVKRIRSTFPDLTSVQILDQQGTIVAMAGDVTLSDGALPSIAKIDWPADSGGLPGGWRFSDDPSANRWHLTCRHSTSRVGVWFVRVTFSREPLEGAGIRAGLTEARSFLMTRYTGEHRSDDYGVEAGSASAPVWLSGWSRLTTGRAETPLRAGGWLVGLTDAPHTGSMYLYPAAVAGLFFLCMVVSLVAVGHPAAPKHRSGADEGRQEPPSTAGYVAVVHERIEQPPDTSARDTVIPETASGQEQEPAQEAIVALAAPPEKVPEFLDVMWVEPADASQEESDADEHGRGSRLTHSFTAAGA